MNLAAATPSIPLLSMSKSGWSPCRSRLGLGRGGSILASRKNPVRWSFPELRTTKVAGRKGFEDVTSLRPSPPSISLQRRVETGVEGSVIVGKDPSRHRRGGCWRPLLGRGSLEGRRRDPATASISSRGLVADPNAGAGALLALGAHARVPEADL